MSVVLLSLLFIHPGIQIQHIALVQQGYLGNTIKSQICPVYFAANNIIFVLALLLLILGSMLYATGKVFPAIISANVQSYGMWMLVGGVAGAAISVSAPYILSAVTGASISAIQDACFFTLPPPPPPPPLSAGTPTAQFIPFAAGDSPDTLYAHPSGGSGVYTTYNWYYSTSPDSSCSVLLSTTASDNYAVQPTSDAYYCYSVTDSGGNSLTSQPLLIRVTGNQQCCAMLSPSPAAFDSDQQVKLTATWPSIAGVTNYVITWVVSSGGAPVTLSQPTTSSSATFTESPGALPNGAYTVNAFVCRGTASPCSVLSPSYDTQGNDLVSVSAQLLAPTISPSTTQSIDMGQNVLFTSSPVTTGTPPYTYQWYQNTNGGCPTGNPTAVPGATSSSNNMWPTSNTNYCLTITDTATTPESATSTNTLVIVSPAFTVTLTPTTNTIDQGQSALIKAIPSAGTTPYTYQWYTSGTTQTTQACGTAPWSSISGAQSQTYSTSTSLGAGIYYYCVVSTDSSLVTAPSSAAKVTVNAGLTLSVSPQTANIDIGQSITLTANPSFGSGIYTYKWYSSGSSTCSATPGLVLGTTQSYSNTPSVSGPSYFCANVIDSIGGTAYTQNAAVVTTGPALTVGITPASTTYIDAPSSQTFTSTVSGGTAPYSYQWLSATPPTACGGNAPGSSTSSTYTATPPSNTNYCLKVTDSATIPKTVTSTNTLIIVNPQFTVVIAPSTPQTIDSGQSVSFTSIGTGGTQPFTFQWRSSSTSGSCAGAGFSNIAGATAPSYSVAPTSTTYYCIAATDSSSPPQTVYSSATQVTANPAFLAGSVTPASPIIDQGQPITLTANPSGGTTPYSYQWYSGSSSTCTSDSPVSGATSATYSPSPSASTYYCYKVIDSASTPQTLFSPTDFVKVNPVLVVGSVTPSSPKLDSGQSVTLTANPSGGTTPYSYQWYSGSSSTCTSDTAISGATSSTYSAAPSTTTYYCYQVTDSSSPPQSLYSATDQVTVNSALFAGAVTPASPSIDSGQPITLTANPSGGTTPYSYQWYSGTSSTCSSDAAVSGATSATYSPSPSTNTYYCYKVTDSASTPTSATSSTDLVTVNPTLIFGSPTPASPKIDSGGAAITLTANPSGGTTPYSYQWYSGSSSTCTSDTAISGATSSTYSASPVTNTYYCYKVTDSSPTPQSGYSSTDLVTVNPALLAGSVTPSAPTLDQGQSVTLTANPSGGTTPYSYQWYSGSTIACTSDTAISGATSSTYSATPSGSTYYCYQVTDSATSPTQVTSSTDRVTVNPQLSIGSVTPVSPTYYGTPITLTANPSGGTTPYSYQWYSGSSAACTSDTAIPGATSATYSASPSSSTYYCYYVKDSASTPESGYSFTDQVTTFTATVNPSRYSLDAGQSVSFTSTVNGGTSPYTYQWYIGGSSTCTSDSPISGATSSNYGPISPGGTAYYCVQVTDAASHVTYSPTVQVTVDPSVSVSPTVSSTAVDVGSHVTVSAGASGGTGSYTYSWSISSGTCPGFSSSSAASFNYFPSGTSAATCAFSVTVTDTNGGQATGTTSTINVYPQLQITSFGPTSQNAAFGNAPGQISATVSGGDSPTEKWYTSGTSTSCSSTSTFTGSTGLSYTPPTESTANTWYYCIVVSDSAGTTLVDTASVTFYPGCTTVLITDSGSLPYSNSITCLITATGSYKPQLYYNWGSTASASAGGVSATGTQPSQCGQTFKSTNSFPASAGQTETLTLSVTGSFGPCRGTIDRASLVQVA